MKISMQKEYEELRSAAEFKHTPDINSKSKKLIERKQQMTGGQNE